MYVCMYAPDSVCVLTAKGHRVEIGAVHFLGGLLSLFGRTRLHPYIHTYIHCVHRICIITEPALPAGVEEAIEAVAGIPVLLL